MSNNNYKKELFKRFEYLKKQKKYDTFNDFLIDNEFDIISESGLFDLDWYLKQYPDVKIRNLDPILHFCTLGKYENCNPNSSFDTEWYSTHYTDVKKVYDNPFLHYIVYGINEGRFINQSDYLLDKDNKSSLEINEVQLKSSLNKFNNTFSLNSIKNICDALSKKVSIIVPIYNAYEDTVLCINKVMENTFGNYELILIDDKSPDIRISEFLDSLEGKNNIKIIRNKENQGFVRNVNIGIENSKNDVILLNSDTKVTPKWLQKLIVAAYMNEKIGTVTPLSNNAGAFSVPKIGIANDIPYNLSLNEMANIVEKSSNRVFMESPTGNGFCMYIKRDTINSVGLFDFENFGKGYCEENDFCMRAIEKGWINIIDDSTYIYHKKGASFSEKREKLIKEHRKILDLKHPSYTNDVRKFLNSNELKLIHSNLDNYLDNFYESKLNKKRILYVLHKGSGGTPQTNADLMSIVDSEYDCYLLTSDRKKMFLQHLVNNEFEDIKEWDLTSKWLAENNYIEEYKNIYFEILITFSIDLVHIRNLINHSFDLPKLCGLLNIPLVLSFHDFYFVCPSYTLIDGNYDYCGGICTENNKKCYNPMRGLTDIKNMKKFVSSWRESVFEMFYNVNHFVTTSDVVKNIFLNAFPLMSTNNFSVIEHGRDFEELNEDLFEVPSLNKPIKILFIGNINTQKGSHFIRELVNLDKNSNLEIHFLGKTAGELKNVGIKHGEYIRDDLSNHIKEIKPSFIGIFSIWSETYCHTLSEAWAFGIPVLSTKIGVLEDRVNKNGGGWFIDHNNAQKTYDLILDIAKNKKEYLIKQNEAKNIKFKSIKEMGDDYLEIYDNLLFRDLDKCLNDDFHFDEIVNPDDLTLDKYLNANLKRTLKGKNDYLFLINDSNSELRQHFDKTYISKFDSDKFNKCIDYKRQFCLNNDIKYYLFSVPDKSIVCKEYLPFKPNYLYRNLDNIHDIVDFTNDLNPNHFFNKDTHISYEGGKILAFLYINNIDSSFTWDKFQDFIDKTGEKISRSHLYDLLMEKNWSYSEKERINLGIKHTEDLFLPKSFIDLKSEIPKEFAFCGKRESNYFKNPNSFSNLRVLVFHDSCTLFIKDYLSFYFKEMFLYWDHGSFDKDVIKWYKPDLILEIRLERFLENLPYPIWFKK